MGTNESKLAEKLPEGEQGNARASVPSTPILTPKLGSISDKSEMDPRSPSKNISRTPIHLLSAVSDRLEELELNDGPVTPIRTKILGIDPRSPALEFQRTPIVVSASPDKKLPESIRNKNLDKVKGITFPTPHSSPAKIPPKLLESTTVTPKRRSLDPAKRKSFVLLETNIDFTETDLDVVILEKYSGRCIEKEHETSQSAENILFCEMDNPSEEPIDEVVCTNQSIKVCTSNNGLNGNNVFNKTEENNDITQEMNENKLEPEEMLHKSVFGIKFEDSVSFVCLSPMSEKLVKNNFITPVIENTKDNEIVHGVINVENSANEGEKYMNEIQKIEQTEENTIIDERPTNTITGETHSDKPCTTTSDQVLEICEEVIRNSPEPTKAKLVLSPIPKAESEIFVQSALKSLNSKAVTPRGKSCPVTPPLIDLTADVKELDKKLSNLIYEDEDLVVCPRIVTIKEQSRTPLGLRISPDNIPNQIAPQKLKVSDKPRKTDYAVSKIPVFKEKKVKKGQVQCENTPPRGMTRRSEVKPKKSRWDAKDDTLVI